MAIDKNKLQAFAEGAPSSKTQIEESEEETPAEGGEMEEGGEGRFGALIPLLEAHAEDVEACAEELSEEAVGDPELELDEGEMAAFTDSAATLPDDLTAAMQPALAGGISPEDAAKLADHLEAEGLISDSERVAAWLYRVASISPAEEAEEEEDDEAEDDEESADLEEDMDQELEAAAYDEMD